MLNFAKILLLLTLSIVTLTFSERLSIPIGGSLLNGSPILNIFFGRKVAFITAADPTPEITGPQTQKFFDRRGINATWVKVFEPCASKVNDPALVRLVDEADAVYFTGGYSDKLQQCLFGDKNTYVPTPLLLAVQRKQIIAGSSAGAMVQPMQDMLLTRNPIESYQAVVTRKVPFSPHAFRAFRRGHVDVHFSERGRQGRLFVFAWMTKTRFAFGIDENTGIIEHQDGRIQVVGEKGVVVYDMINQSLQNGTLHYLTEGDIFMPDGRVIYPAWKRPCRLVDTPARNSTNIFTDFKRVSEEHALYSKNTLYRGVVGRNPIVEVTMSKSSSAQTMCGTFNQTNFRSFSGMTLSMGVTSFEKLGYYGDEPKFLESTYIDL